MEEEKRILSILEEMNTRFDRTDERLEKIESRLAKTESDIRHNSDRLSDYEIIKLKVNHLDSEVLKLNEKIMTSA